MPLIIRESKRRTLGRVIGWHIIDFIITICLSFAFGLSIKNSVLLSLIDTIAELVIHYFYERFWLRVKSGMIGEEEDSRSTNSSGGSSRNNIEFYETTLPEDLQNNYENNRNTEYNYTNRNRTISYETEI